MLIYNPLHVHSQAGSVGDSVLKIESYVKKAKEYGLKALTLTNHGSLADIFEFSKVCFENDIKPIIGCEVYLKNENEGCENKPYHLVLIAKNREGFKNLLAIHNYGQLDGFYYKPQVTKQIIKKYSKNLICLSACVGGEIPKNILESSTVEKAVELINLIKEYKEIFKDDFYLEIQPGNFNEQKLVNKSICNMYKDLGVNIVATNDIHYLEKEDYVVHNIHVCARRKIKTYDKLCYPDKCYYMCDGEEIKRMLCESIDEQYAIEAINNTSAIVDKCESYKITSDDIFMPDFDIPKEFENEYEYIYYLCFKRLKALENKIEDVNEYSSRIEYEMETIRDLGFGGYFLVVRDYIEFCNNNNIKVGPGRGSCCGSLILYLLEITKVDPIKYDLMFERFLSKHRRGMPDIDVDIDAKKRDLVFEYIVNKYGKERCALVSTFIERKSKSALKDTARVYNIDSDIVENVCSLIPEVYYTESENGEEKEKHVDVSIEDALELSEELCEYYKKYEDWFNAAIKLTDIARNTSVHAAGTLIAPVNLTDFIPLVRSKNDNILATQLMLKDAEAAGFIKYDLLALNTLSIFRETEEHIGRKVLDDIDDNYDDKEVWKTIASRNTTGLFQISSLLYKQRMSSLNPTNIKELAACLALVRGPCIASGDDKKYIDAKKGITEIEKIHDIYDKVTESTYGVLIYQEQLMKICFNLGFELDEGYAIMKSSSKKKMKELKEYEKKFYILGEKMNIEKPIIKRIFKMIVDSGLYSFNESHAVAYAICCYQSAWLKKYYPVEYLAATLTACYENKKNVEETIEECFKQHIEFLPVDINKSEWKCTVEDGKIRLGFCSIKSFGKSATEEVLRIRPITSIDDFFEKVKKAACKKSNTYVLILAGGFDSVEGEDRMKTFSKYHMLHEPKKEMPDKYEDKTSKISIDLSEQNYVFEKILLGSDFISSPITQCEKIYIEDCKDNKELTVVCDIVRVKKLKDKNKNNMSFFDAKTSTGIYSFVVFASTYEKVKKKIKKSNICEVTFKKKKDSLIVENII